MKDSNRKKPGTWLMRGGTLLLAAALFLTGYNLWDEHRAGESVRRILAELPGAPEQSGVPEQPEAPVAPNGTEIPDYILDPGREMPTEEMEGSAYIGTLEIPVLGLFLPVMSDWNYPKLRIAPCRYTGSAYVGNLVIMAHNYSSHFGGIGGLPAGETIKFTDVDGNVFIYTVTEVQLLQPTAVADMVADRWDLTLFTCTLGGASRVTVRCEKVMPRTWEYFGNRDISLPEDRGYGKDIE